MTVGVPDGTPSRRTAGRWWLVLVLVASLMVVGTVVGLRRLVPPLDPGSGPVTSASSASTGPSTTPAAPRPDPGAPVVVREGAGPLLPGIGDGQVYAQSATGVFRIEVGTGRIVRTATPELEQHLTFLAGRGWVLIKSRWSPTGALVRDGRPAASLPHQLDAEGLLHPGPGEHVWVQPEPGVDPRPTTILRLVDLDGRPVDGRTVTAPRSAAPYSVVPDGYGGVLLATRLGVYRLEPRRAGHPGRMRSVSRGALVAAGGHRLLVQDCVGRARCRLLLVDQRPGHHAVRPAAARTLLAEGGVGVDRDAYGDAMLSPDGTHLAVMAADRSGEFRAHVVDLRDGRDAVLPGVGPDENVNRQLAWSRNSRWLLALTDHRLRGYDTRTRTTSDVLLGDEPLLHLTTEHAPGW